MDIMIAVIGEDPEMELKKAMETKTAPAWMMADHFCPDENSFLFLKNAPNPEKPFAEQARRGEIDVKGCLVFHERQLGNVWDRIQPAIAPYRNLPFRDANSFLEGKRGAEALRAIDEYRAQPIVAAAAKAGLAFSKDFLLPKKDFVKKRAHALSAPFALLKDGILHEWHKIINNGRGAERPARPTLEWFCEYAELMAQTPPDALVTAIEVYV